MAVVGDDADRFFVEAQYDPLDCSTVGGLETDPVAPGEAGHQAGAFGLGNELEPLNDQPVEKKEILFIQPFDRRDS